MTIYDGQRQARKRKGRALVSGVFSTPEDRRSVLAAQDPTFVSNPSGLESLDPIHPN